MRRLLDRVDEDRGVGQRHDDVGAAAGQRDVRPAGPTDVEQRHRHQGHRGLVELPRLRDVHQSRAVGVGEHHALGQTGRAGRVQLQHHVVVRRLAARVRVGGGLEPGGVVVPGPHDALQARRLRLDRGHHLLERRADDHHRGARVVHDATHLGRGQPEVQRRDGGAHPGGADHHLEELRVVEVEVGDPPVLADAEVGQRVGDAVGVGVELGVRHRALRPDQRGVVAAPLGELGEHLRHRRGVGHRIVTPAPCISSRALFVVAGATPAHRLCSRRVSKPPRTASRAVARTQ